MASDGKLANVVGGRSARACDGCVRRRARWYCAADDAFLCQACDSSVHTANSLARRHERVRLKNGASAAVEAPAPPWHRGVKRKARTPRKHGKLQVTNPLHMVPEIFSEGKENEDVDEELLLFRVPILDPFGAELCTNQSEAVQIPEIVADSAREITNLDSFLPPEKELEEFAADVECFLAKDSNFEVQGLGVFDWGMCMDDHLQDCESLKHHDEAAMADNHRGGSDLGMERSLFELNFDDMPISYNDLELGVEPVTAENTPRSKTFLKLDVDGVISAWDMKKSPWVAGERPKLKSIDLWSDFMGTPEGGGGHTAGSGDREARVSRYKEKRRTRLFAKKIRYEVRKVNAEKRPRMKGRFIKRSNFAPPSQLL